MHIGDVTPDAIERLRLKDKEFELFVRELLTAEREMRHSDAKVMGPVAAYHADGQRDLVFEVRKAPKISREDFHHCLTWDQLGQTWYSCKGGRGWRASFLKELGGGAANTGAAPTSRVRLRPSEPLLSHIARGGRFVFVIAEGTLGADEFLDHVVMVLKFWLGHTNRESPQGLRHQLELIDANDLADFIARKRPTTLSERFRAALQIDGPPGFMSWAQWTAQLAGGREAPDFESDRSRDAILAAIADDSNRTLKVFGPPGTGKTRVVHEGIRRLDEEARARVRFCGDLDAAHRIGSWLRDSGAVWLVLDELRTIDVEQLIPTFEANAPKGARLILVGTSDEGTRSDRETAFELVPLEDGAIERLIEHELGRAQAPATRAAVELVRTLSESYPWYAVLLARAVAEDAGHIALGVDDASRWNFGARRVLAGNPKTGDHGDYASVSEWRREAELRAKCLLVAMMTRDLELPWAEVWASYGPRLALAIDEPNDGHEVKIREPACRQRQLLRQSGLRAQRRYVSPNNLARLIINHFFSGPHGPDLGPRVRRYVPELRGSLLTIARSVHAQQSVIDDFVRGEWDELIRRAERRDIEAVEEFLTTASGKLTVSFDSARSAPGIAARSLTRMLGCFDDAVLRPRTKIRQRLFYILSHLTHRAIDEREFEDVESSLFRLASIGDDHWTSNSASAWKHLFLPRLHLTHQPWSVRVGRLDRRLHSDAEPDRVLAIAALEVAVDPREQSVVLSDLDEGLDGDSEWPRPTPQQWIRMKTELWDRLVLACGDEQTAVADRARAALTTRLRAGLGRGLLAAHLQQLAAEIPSWTAPQRQVLRGAISLTMRHEAEALADDSEIAAALHELDELLSPQNLHERIVEHIKGWARRRGDDGRLDLDHERRVDEQLARELLDSPRTRAQTLQWLSIQEGSLRDGFLRVLGATDHDELVWDDLAELARRGSDSRVLSSYLIGRARADGPEPIDAWVVRQPNDPIILRASLDYLVDQRPSEARLSRIEDLIDRGAPPERLEGLVHRRWAKHVPAAAMTTFLHFLMRIECPATVTLPLIVQLIERESGRSRAGLLELLSTTLSESLEHRVVIAAQECFEQGVLVLSNEGRFDTVAALIAKAFLESDAHNNVWLGHRVLESIVRRGLAADLWPHLAATLLERRGSALAMHLSRDGLVEHVTPDLIASWIGHSHKRARIAAELCNPHAEQLDELTRQLIIRFGAEGDIARSLQSRARSSPHAVWGGMTVFYRQQHENAARWADDPHPAVRAWAKQLEEYFRRAVEEDEAREEFRRKYG